MSIHYENLKRSYNKLLQTLQEDSAGYASTQLHFFRTRCDELDTLTHHLFLTDVITFDQVSDIKYLSSRAHEIIKNRLQERILWLARGIDQTIENRKQNDTYKGEFTTAVILANAFNDIFYNQFGEFDIKEGENK
jgi:tRNA(His) 5'-end guanylyltransferase